MSVEKTNARININGALNISDYERKLRSLHNGRKLYRNDLMNWIESKNLDPVVKEKVIAETSSIPCQAINHMFPRMEDLVRRIQKEVNLERSSISESVVIPEKTTNSIDIGDLYSSINNTSEATDEAEQIEEPVSDLVQENTEQAPEN